jgi:hypothetical protein
MHYLPGLAGLEEDPRKTWVCDILLTVAVKLGKEQSEMNQVRSLLLSLLYNEDSENKNLEGIMPYISMIFQGLIGRCLFMSSNTATISQKGEARIDVTWVGKIFALVFLGSALGI